MGILSRDPSEWPSDGNWGYQVPKTPKTPLEQRRDEIKAQLVRYLCNDIPEPKPMPNHADALDALEHFIDCLRERGVRSFKGELLSPDGTKLWNLEMTFEREPTTKPTTRDPMTG